jgi:PKD repeat protein
VPEPDGSIGPTDLAILSARAGVARFGASRFGFYPDEVEGTGTAEPGEYVWKEAFPPTTEWTLDSLYSYCGTRPVAAFSMSPEPSEVGAAVQFTDESTPTEIVSFWAWDFGDGGTSNEQHPSHVYDAAGTYTVTLHVSGVHGSASTSDDHVVAVGLEAHFSWVSGFNKVTFTDLSTGSPTGWAWTFGDLATSSLQNPIRIYGVQGVYTVTLTIVGPGGTDDVSTSVDCTPNNNSGSV